MEESRGRVCIIMYLHISSAIHPPTNTKEKDSRPGSPGGPARSPPAAAAAEETPNPLHTPTRTRRARIDENIVTIVTSNVVY